MKIIANVKDLLQDIDGNGVLSLKVSNLHHVSMLKNLDTNKTYSVEIKEVRSHRTVEQNKYLWALIHDIDVAMNTERSSDEMSVYIQILERAGAKFEYIGCLEEAEDILKQSFRAVKRIKPIDLNGKDGYMYKCFLGSSKMNTKEFSLVLETALDIAQELGIETTYYREVINK